MGEGTNVDPYTAFSRDNPPKAQGVKQKENQDAEASTGWTCDPFKSSCHSRSGVLNGRRCRGKAVLATYTDKAAVADVAACLERVRVPR